MSKRLTTYYLLFFLVLSCLACGLFFFLIKRNFLIIQFTLSPSITRKETLIKRKASHNKQIKAFFGKDDKLQHEQISVIWDDDNALENLKNTVAQWLNLLKDEDILPRHLYLKSTTMSSLESDGYLSFSHSLFSKEWSIIKKWYIIESLIKTLQETHLPLHSIRILVNHQEMPDDHIDLSQSIPLHEFLVS